MGLSLVLQAPALAHVRIESTSLTLNVRKTEIDQGDRATFRGHLRSDWSQCFSNLRVRLFRWGTPVATDITNDNGFYFFVRHPVSSARWSVKFAGRKFGTHPHVHRCLQSSSRHVFVKVDN